MWVQHSLHGTEHLDRRTMYDMYDMYMADFHAACVGEAALEALAQCANLGLSELEPDVIHCEDGGPPHDGSGWTKVVAGPRRKHPQDMRQGLARRPRLYAYIRTRSTSSPTLLMWSVATLCARGHPVARAQWEDK